VDRKNVAMHLVALNASCRQATGEGSRSIPAYAASSAAYTTSDDRKQMTEDEARLHEAHRQ